VTYLLNLRKVQTGAQPAGLHTEHLSASPDSPPGPAR